VLVVERAFRDLMRDWLRLIEALVRRALLVDALALLGSGLRALTLRVRINAPSPPPPMEGDDPALWRVAFRTGGAPAAGNPARPHWRAAPHPFDARPLAKRLEALIRVVAAPQKAIARLARRLGRANGRQLAASMLKAPKAKADPQGWMLAD